MSKFNKLMLLSFTLLFLFNSPIKLIAESLYQQIYDPENDVTIPHIDVTELNTSIDGELLTVEFNLVDIPEQIFFNRIGVPENYTEYEWSVRIDVDNNQQTGNALDKFLGIDYTLSAMHFIPPDSINSNLAASIDMGVQVNVWEADGNGNFNYLEDASIIVDTQLNTIVLKGTIPGISSSSNIYFSTFDYNPDGVIESDTGGGSIDNIEYASIILNEIAQEEESLFITYTLTGQAIIDLYLIIISNDGVFYSITYDHINDTSNLALLTNFNNLMPYKTDIEILGENYLDLYATLPIEIPKGQYDYYGIITFNCAEKKCLSFDIKNSILE